MRFDQNFIDKVQNANDLVEIVSQHTKLSATGANLMGLCPFPDHREKSPSFSVSAQKQLYKCFGCSKGGNVFTFLKDFSGLSFAEAVEFLANRASIELPKSEVSSKEQDALIQSKKMSEAILEEAKKAYHQEWLKLPLTHPAKKYLEDRGILPKTIEIFQIGFAPDTWEFLSISFPKKDLSLAKAQDLGLVKRRPQGTYYDIFRNRILFPIISPMSKVLGFGGRVVNPEDQPKYLNSPESEVFHKSKTMYGLNETAKYIRSQDQVLVVEGYMDLVSLFQHGICNLAANLGTAFTKDHAKILKRYTQNVVMLLDGDAAGQNAMKRALPILLEEGIYAKGLSLPDGLDPDDYVRKFGADALRDLIGKSEDLFLWFLQDCLKSFHGKPTEKLQVLDQMMPLLKVIPDTRLIKIYLAEMAYFLDLEIKWLEKTYMQYKGAKPAPEKVLQKQELSQEMVKPETLDASKLIPEELELLNLALCEEIEFRQFLELKLHEHFMSDMAVKIWLYIENVYRQEASDFARLGSLLINQVTSAHLLTKHVSSQYGIGSGDDVEMRQKRDRLRDMCIHKLDRMKMKKELQKVKNNLKTASDFDSLKNLSELVKNKKINRHEERE